MGKEIKGIIFRKWPTKVKRLILYGTASNCALYEVNLRLSAG